jgi:hypothetical protein
MARNVALRPSEQVAASLSKEADSAAQQRDAPVETLGLRMLHDGPSFIYVRLAGDRCCSADMEVHERNRYRHKTEGVRRRGA